MNPTSTNKTMSSSTTLNPSRHDREIKILLTCNPRNLKAAFKFADTDALCAARDRAREAGRVARTAWLQNEIDRRDS